MLEKRVLVIGAGLAGSDASFYLAEKGVQVVLVENKTLTKNPAQKIDSFAELVCTNSLKSLNPDSAHGLLKTEMEALGSLVIKCAKESAVPAGDALAVDRDKFSALITTTLHEHPNITVVAREADNPLELAAEFECSDIIVATGPLTTDKLTGWIQENLAEDDFYFYDAIAPVVDADSLDYSKLYFKDRHKEIDDSADYLNAPMNKEQYEQFVEELVKAEKVQPKDFEEYKFFEACLPIDLMAERGKDTPRFSCMKPIGLKMADGTAPYAVVQLRKENLLGSAFNLVGFQTRLKYPEQKRVFSMIPGFENASFIHLGSVHRNSFLNARKLLNWDLSAKKYPQLHFAGQMTGVEGYTESASSGLYVAYNLYKKLMDKEFKQFPVETAMGALVNYIMTCEKPCPSNINFGLIPSVTLTREQRRSRSKKRVKKEIASQRAREVFASFLEREPKL
ncbi:MAG: methylenetetrahydrofolate--tRNA-(uracil(54)-C(5))-methyltransferase (FADH(2)-oxidizing) TrmFO [Halobacteriovoraceae bacterium]|nr:methylenetetrahydrofolate--tRNA-(uracil(54)-C(5))-methyltransferase (FADH(2)-oxidizing) TrmFO [Halobacteriovoraceae bacterium]|tara:strand:+ start:19489 stop:20841 length:1353 start_codon:yes stop_codon:yes gene_type:complete